MYLTGVPGFCIRAQSPGLTEKTKSVKIKLSTKGKLTPIGNFFIEWPLPFLRSAYLIV